MIDEFWRNPARSLVRNPMKPSQRVAKNTAWGVMSGVVGGGFQFLYVIVVAHNLGVGEFGTFNYLLAFAILFQFLADFGLVNILVREIARRPDDLNYLLGSAKGLMWFMFFISVPLLAILVLVQNIPTSLKAQSFLMGVASLTLLQGVSYAAVLRAFEDMEFNSIGFTLHKVALLALTMMSLKVGFGLWGIVLSNLAANLLLWLYYFRIISWRFGLKVSSCKDVVLWKSMIMQALPLGGGLLLRQVSWQLDSLLLYWLVDSFSVGLFSGPYRLLLAVRAFSMILVLPIYPGLVRLADDSLANFWAAYDRSLKWLICLSVPGTVIFLITPEFVVRTLLGTKFLGSVQALQWFGLAFVPMFISALFPYVYTALGRQRIFLLTVGASLILRLLLQLWLIPKFGYMSACLVAVGCEIVQCAIFVIVLSLGRSVLSPAEVFIKPAVAGIIMGLILCVGRNQLDQSRSLIIMVVLYFLAGVVYSITLFCLRTFSKDEFSVAKEGLSFLGPYLRSFRQKPETPR